jgi:hypothetical protein
MIASAIRRSMPKQRNEARRELSINHLGMGIYLAFLWASGLPECPEEP